MKRLVFVAVDFDLRTLDFDLDLDLRDCGLWADCTNAS